MTDATVSEFDLPDYVCSPACASCQFAPTVTPPPQKAQTLLMDSERAAILEALRASGDNLSRAAVMLGVSRVTLYRRLKKHQIRSDYT
jgi:transcriptional regulator of acetoin/glycerol metabolism